MTILYLAYWGINDGLTTSTVFPHLEILCRFDHIKKVVFCTIERDGIQVAYNGPENPKISYCPLYSQNFKPSILNKALDFILFPKTLLNLCADHRVQKIISRGAPAGALAYKVFSKSNIPYIVESYEPHAAYMLESGVWQWWNPKYIFETRWENQIKKTASMIVTVSSNYALKLQQEGVPKNRLSVVPCCVNQERFSYNEHHRTTIRHQLGIQEEMIAGVYLGKFGGIYYDQEAFNVFKQAFDFWGDKFFLILLSPDYKELLTAKLHQHNIPLHKVFIRKASHSEVPMYLSAADFAFAFYRPNKSALYLSPVKFGEYWANGLPILTPDGIGDDSAIIKKEKIGGIVFELSNLKPSFEELRKKLATTNRLEQYNTIKQLALTYRNFDILHQVYAQAIKEND